jgi:hypothetical protein
MVSGRPALVWLQSAKCRDHPIQGIAIGLELDDRIPYGTCHGIGILGSVGMAAIPVLFIIIFKNVSFQALPMATQHTARPISEAFDNGGILLLTFLDIVWFR